MTLSTHVLPALGQTWRVLASVPRDGAPPPPRPCHAPAALGLGAAGQGAAGPGACRCWVCAGQRDRGGGARPNPAWASPARGGVAWPRSPGDDDPPRAA